MIEGRVCRYTEHDGVFHLTEWIEDVDCARGPRHRSGAVAARPAWLVRAVNFGKVGGHAYYPVTPPPDFILWFVTDPRRVVREFRSRKE